MISKSFSMLSLWIAKQSILIADSERFGNLYLTRYKVTKEKELWDLYTL